MAEFVYKTVSAFEGSIEHVKRLLEKRGLNYPCPTISETVSLWTGQGWEVVSVNETNQFGNHTDDWSARQFAIVLKKSR